MSFNGFIKIGTSIFGKPTHCFHHFSVIVHLVVCNCAEPKFGEMFFPVFDLLYDSFFLKRTIIYILALFCEGFKNWSLKIEGFKN
jgi:hypothetical protein